MITVKKRIDTIDIMRALAIIFMIPLHIYVYWPPFEKGIFGSIMILFGGLPGPIFLTISGTSFFLFINKKKK